MDFLGNMAVSIFYMELLQIDFFIKYTYIFSLKYNIEWQTCGIDEQMCPNIFFMLGQILDKIMDF